MASGGLNVGKGIAAEVADVKVTGHCRKYVVHTSISSCHSVSVVNWEMKKGMEALSKFM